MQHVHEIYSFSNDEKPSCKLCLHAQILKDTEIIPNLRLECGRKDEERKHMKTYKTGK